MTSPDPIGKIALLLLLLLLSAFATISLFEVIKRTCNVRLRKHATNPCLVVEYAFARQPNPDLTSNTHGDILAKYLETSLEAPIV